MRLACLVRSTVSLVGQVALGIVAGAILSTACVAVGAAPGAIGLLWLCGMSWAIPTVIAAAAAGYTILRAMEQA